MNVIANWEPGWHGDDEEELHVPWEKLDFGEGVYLDHDKLALDAEREESREIEEFWAQQQMKQDLFYDPDAKWDTDYERRKSKARWRHWTNEYE